LSANGLPGIRFCLALTIAHAIRFVNVLALLPAWHAGAKACSMVSSWHPHVLQRSDVPPAG